ncbi:ankyrin repeat-containing domain protein, partial [Fusarium flagelliforme]
NGQTALHFAVLQGYQSVLKPLLDSDPSLVSATNEFAQTPLLLAVVRGSSSAIKLLLERSADAKALDRFNTSILHHAVSTDKASVLKLILD